jgi:hypothetical protein
MQNALGLIAILATFTATEASAQNFLNLSGRYLCVQGCASGIPGQPAYITQNGWDMNIVTETGIASRAWIDWPGHIWIPNFQEGAIYSPDGMTIQFDRGTVWQRDLGLPPPPPPPLRQRRK